MKINISELVWLLAILSYRGTVAESEDLGCKDIASRSTTLRLKRRLFCDYDPAVRPTLNHKVGTNVTMKLMPKSMNFDSYTGLMTLHSWMPLSWMDAHLTWNPSEYDDIDYIQVKSTDLWVPDLSIYNSGDMSAGHTGIPETNCMLFKSGIVSCVPSVKYTSKCVTDFTYWPFDSHECSIKFGSWSHTGEEISFNIDKTGIQMEGFINSTIWDLRNASSVKVVKKFKCCPNDTFPLITYKFSLARHFNAKHSVYIIPAVVLIVLTLTVLWLDSRSIERVAVASVNFVCHLLCMFDLNWQLPHNGVNPPNILLFYRDSLSLAAFALMLTVLLRKLQNVNSSVPTWISSTTTFVLNNPAGRFLILANENGNAKGSDALDEDTDENLNSSNTKAPSTWRQFSALVEWLSFFVVLFTYIVILFVLIPV